MASALINSHRNVAVAIRRSRRGVAIVAHDAGKLSLQHLPASEFAQTWQEYDYPLEQLLDRFLAHARTVGATKAALNAIVALRADAAALAPRLL